MEVFEAILSRIEVREYSGESVPDDVKLKILEAARMSPTGLNLQHWRFILVEDKDSIRRLAELSTTGKWVAGADFAIIVLTDPKYPFHLIDAGRAIQNMQLTAWSMGVGSCIYTGVREREMKKEYRIPEDLTIAAVVGFGYPKRKIKGLKNRRRLSEVAFSERFGEKLRLI
ncbi:MAG: nitroreductase family protein [Thaumarchaeota archaeon]|jgi:nitroreductase|nr:nitroreductase family protein [Candidatus Geocrenenecus arthurdayi]